MNQTLQLTDYIPQYVSLYYVDYRDDLDEHEDIQEECIRSNNMEKLYEKAYEWYEEQESSNMHDYLEETRKNMEADNLAGEFEKYEDEIRELIYDRNDSDPVKDLIRNSSVTNFFYSLGVDWLNPNRPPSPWIFPRPYASVSALLLRCLLPFAGHTHF